MQHVKPLLLTRWSLTTTHVCSVQEIDTTDEANLAQQGLASLPCSCLHVPQGCALPSAGPPCRDFEPCVAKDAFFTQQGYSLSSLWRRTTVALDPYSLRSHCDVLRGGVGLHAPAVCNGGLHHGSALGRVPGADRSGAGGVLCLHASGRLGN